MLKLFDLPVLRPVAPTLLKGHSSTEDWTMSTSMMKQTRAWLLGGAVSAVLLAIGCSSAESAKDKDGVGTQSQSLWGCETKGSKVVCTAPKAAEAPEKEGDAYACDGTGKKAGGGASEGDKDGKAGKGGSDDSPTGGPGTDSSSGTGGGGADGKTCNCPDTGSVGKTPGLDDLIKKTGKGGGGFEKLPWACLLTGKNQVTCARECGKGDGSEDGDDKDTGDSAPCTGTGTGGAGTSIPGLPGGGSIPGLPSGGSIPGFPSAGGSGGYGGAGGSCTNGWCPVADGGAPPSTPSTPCSKEGKGGAGAGTKPPPPASCKTEDWEPYFAKLASYIHKKHNIDIDFPREIIDCKQSMMSAALGRASVKSTPGAPSCHDAEWEMRMEAWMTAVQQGCMNLNNPILVMCEQATVYAPNTTKCNSTGAW